MVQECRSLSFLFSYTQRIAENPISMSPAATHIKPPACFIVWYLSYYDKSVHQYEYDYHVMMAAW